MQRPTGAHVRDDETHLSNTQHELDTGVTRMRMDPLSSRVKVPI